MKISYLVFVLLLVATVSCKTDHLDVDISSIDVNVKVQRFDQDLMNISRDNITKSSDGLGKKYGTFYKRFLQNITGLGLPNDPMLSTNLSNYIKDQYVLEVSQDVNSVYPSCDILGSTLTEGFKYYKYHFPGKTVPDVLTFISGFQCKVVVLDSVLAVSLDMYLGNAYSKYQLAGLPNYLVQHTNKYNMAPDAMRGWLTTEFSEQSKTKVTFLDEIIRKGKTLYLMDAIMRSTPDSLKIGYTSKQLDFCLDNEFMIWANLLENSILHESDISKYELYLRDGPFTTGLPKESPSRVGVWIGWQIIRSYMKNNPELSLMKLMEMQDSKLILARSKYKPSK